MFSREKPLSNIVVLLNRCTLALFYRAKLRKILPQILHFISNILNDCLGVRPFLRFLLPSTVLGFFLCHCFKCIQSILLLAALPLYFFLVCLFIFLFFFEKFCIQRANNLHKKTKTLLLRELKFQICYITIYIVISVYFLNTIFVNIINYFLENNLNIRIKKKSQNNKIS